ncbi:cobalt-zinc-cadmium efflux system membrane fusion protein [Flavobacterium sp. 90]|uniref:efflux RND transporter periplasmic adaptor subunit n=1 Tax=unclassified Flavobacterium TaxID=196869 RepID=UPI000EAFDD19|nr:MULTISPECIES: efflux RND transporter periplasmic adaptor subunit [unclassified Flavobacterium]RKR05536.1 cobalt-zinc-cadmium efflux system membrane fusion protein [Flavobacterium sp. 81]TCK56851.1 cobalt-zinc-cadmium efflux system membrane fusion protein [Flavobacterium sp. 90]
MTHKTKCNSRILLFNAPSKKIEYPNIILFLLTITILTACNDNKIVTEKENYAIKGDTIIVPSTSVIASKLKLETIKNQPYQSELITAGTVKAIPNFYAEIAPPFSGRVTKVHLKLGMKTQPGKPLFEMVSPDFIDAQKNFFQAKSAYQAARLSLKRQQDLKANGVGSQKDLEEAQTNFEVNEKEYQNTIASLKIFGVNVNKLIFGQPLIVTSPIAGEIITNEVVMGQYIKADDTPRAKVADLKKVWVAGQVKEKDIHFIHELDGAEIQVGSYPNKKITGKIYHVDEIVDETTRSIQVLIECLNSDHALKPGMYVTVKFTDTPKNTLFVPAKAVLQFNDKSFVLVQIAKGEYTRRYVETGISNNGKIAILSGLKPNETIISQGAFYLLEVK